MQLEIGSVEKFLVACKRHHSSSYLHVVRTEMREFLCQYGFKPHKRFGNHFEFLFHLYIYLFYYLWEVKKVMEVKVVKDISLLASAKEDIEV